jgi:enoyl-CoA hydratase
MPDVLFEAAAPIATITLHRPDKRNAVHRPMAQALRMADGRWAFSAGTGACR